MKITNEILYQMTNEILQKYEKRKNKFSTELSTIEKKILLISNIRLAIVVFSLISVIILYKFNHQTLSGIVFFTGLTGFIIAINYHDGLFNTKDRLNILIRINTKGIKRITDQWHTFNNTGKEFINDDHPYTSDIDVFGNSSLFQWINATHTYFGNRFLSSTLANSQDRTTGAIAVLDVLQLNNTMGIISTHDLKLCNLSDNPGSKFINYHFREYYKNNSIKFDYKIYPGPSKTRNAIFLIKMVGIPIKD